MQVYAMTFPVTFYLGSARMFLLPHLRHLTSSQLLVNKLTVIKLPCFDMLPLPAVILLLNCLVTPQPVRAVRVLFSPMVSRWAGSRVDRRAVGKKIVWAVSQKP